MVPSTSIYVCIKLQSLGQKVRHTIGFNPARGRILWDICQWAVGLNYHNIAYEDNKQIGKYFSMMVSAQKSSLVLGQVQNSWFLRYQKVWVRWNPHKFNLGGKVNNQFPSCRCLKRNFIYFISHMAKQCSLKTIRNIIWSVLLLWKNWT